uniref:Uncharacterized protein n=1 Tax=Clastoptera arizonana TaxID=38151 RepID=A0A1B6CK21_9HEMI
MHLLFKLFILLHLFQTYLCSCYFSVELQGEFLMQSVATGSRVQYSKVNITSDAIPIWGSCHRHIGSNVLLIDSLNGGSCIRCFNIKLRSKNILQVHTEGLDKCYTKEEAAESTCLVEGSLNKYKEIILYKIKGIEEEIAPKAYCPINGKYKFKYSINDGTQQKMECSSMTSVLDDCPIPGGNSSALNLRFQGCSFKDHEIRYECLGDWEGPNNQRYLALMDNRFYGEQRPQFRCALYQEDKITGIIHMALSSDSTCITDLQSATSGFETYTLSSVGFGDWNQENFNSPCRFPLWSEGEWEHIRITDNSILYRDHTTFQTLFIHCIQSYVGDNERYLVYSQNACGEDTYSCIWIKQRGLNVLEFQLGATRSKDFNNSLCSNANFVDNIWVTQGRLEQLSDSPCPLMGEYTGFIPNETRLCAKLSSDEESPELMYYSVSDCMLGEIYEERRYRCLGQWNEGGLTYTYTQRKDINLYECFVGKIISSNEIYIKEAGEHCERGIDPLKLGMKLMKKNTQKDINTYFVPKSPTTFWYSSKIPVSPTKPWKTITAPPRQSGEPKNVPHLLFVVFVVCSLQFIFTIHHW